MKIYSDQIFKNFSLQKQYKEIYKLILLIENNSFVNEREDVSFTVTKYISFLSNDEQIVFNKEMLFNARQRQELLTNLESKLNLNIKDDNIFQDKMIITKDDNVSREKYIRPFILILDNLRSAFNVGSIFRTAESLSVQKIYLTKSTPTPKNEKVKKTSMSAYQWVEWDQADDIKQLIYKYKQLNYSIYALETVKNATLYSEETYNRPLVLILGNEKLGLSADVLSFCDKIISIPMSGIKNSLNVGVSFGICGFEINKNWSNKKT